MTVAKSEPTAKSAKLRAMRLLNDMGRTEAQLRTKLKQGGYQDDDVEEAIAYVKSFGYVNDLEYARSFIESRKGRKSRKEMYAALEQKGIQGETIDQAFEESYEIGDSQAAIEEIIRKKRFDPETAEYAEKQKLAGYLMRKGFAYEDVRRAVGI